MFLTALIGVRFVLSRTTRCRMTMSFLFAVERTDPQPALFISSGRSRDVFYYRTAMDAAINTGLTIQPVSWGQAAGTDLSHYAYVVISDDGGVDDALERKLADYVRRGGSLFILLGSGSLLHNRVPVTGDHVAETHDAADWRRN